MSYVSLRSINDKLLTQTFSGNSFEFVAKTSNLTSLFEWEPRDGGDSGYLRCWTTGEYLSVQGKEVVGGPVDKPDWAELFGIQRINGRVRLISASTYMGLRVSENSKLVADVKCIEGPGEFAPPTDEELFLMEEEIEQGKFVGGLDSCSEWHDPDCPIFTWKEETHQHLLYKSLAIVEKHLENLPFVQECLELFFRNPDFRNNVHLYLHKADNLEKYTGNLWGKHFYNPETKLSFFERFAFPWERSSMVPTYDPAYIPQAELLRYQRGGSTNGRVGVSQCTALTEGLRLFRDSIEEAQKIYAEIKEQRDVAKQRYERLGELFGVVLHYVTDMAQPMHTVGFTNGLGDPEVPDSVIGSLVRMARDRRHRVFEAYSEKRQDEAPYQAKNVAIQEIDSSQVGIGRMGLLIHNTAAKTKPMWKGTYNVQQIMKDMWDQNSNYTLPNDRKPWMNQADTALAVLLPNTQKAMASAIVLWATTVSAPEVVNNIYLQVLRRNAKPEEISIYAPKLATGEVVVKWIVQQLYRSEEYGKNFVDRNHIMKTVRYAYLHLLNREPEEAPHELVWGDTVRAGRYVELLDRMLGSEEYNQKFGLHKIPGYNGKSIKYLVNEIFWQILERKAFANDLDKWGAQLHHGEITVREIIRKIGKSQDHLMSVRSDPSKAVDTYYRHFLARKPNDMERNVLYNLLIQNRWEEAVDSLVDSNEYLEKWGGNKVPAFVETPAILIHRIYQQVLKRSARADNVEYWMPRLRHGVVTVKGIVTQLALSDEFWDSRWVGIEKPEQQPLERLTDVFYERFLARQAESEGARKGRVPQLQRGEWRSIVREFVDSEEYGERFGEYKVPIANGLSTPEEQVTRLFNEVANRKPTNYELEKYAIALCNKETDLTTDKIKEEIRFKKNYCDRLIITS